MKKGIVFAVLACFILVCGCSKKEATSNSDSKIALARKPIGPTTTISPPANAASKITVKLDPGGSDVEVFFYTNLSMGSPASPRVNIFDPPGSTTMINPTDRYVIHADTIAKSVDIYVKYNGNAPFSDPVIYAPLNPKDFFIGTYSSPNGQLFDRAEILVADAGRF